MISGINIGSMDMSDIDSEFSDNLIIDSFEKILDYLPNPEKIDFGTMLVIEGDYQTTLEFNIPLQPTRQFIECLPGKIPIKIRLQ